MPSTPGLPLLALTRANACLQFSRSQTSSINRSPMAGLSACRFAYSPLPLTCWRRTVRAFGSCLPTSPSADFCRPVRRNRFPLSLDSETNGRSPEVSSVAFRTQPPNLQPAPLMDMGFAVICLLARRRMPLIRFLYIGSCVCSTLLSDPLSPKCPCASLSLHLHQVVKGTFTPKLSNMLGTHKKAAFFKGGFGLAKLIDQTTLWPAILPIQRLRIHKREESPACLDRCRDRHGLMSCFEYANHGCCSS